MVGQVAGHYQVLEELGEGGMGVVYKCLDTGLDRFVALKFLPPGNTSDPARLRRFMREAKAASSLNHPNIVTVYEVGTDPEASYIAMEYIEGSTLQAIIRKGPFPPLGRTERRGMALHRAGGGSGDRDH